VLTLGEIRKGVAGLPRADLKRSWKPGWNWISNRVFSGRILPIDRFIADRWGLLSTEAKRRGKSLSAIEGLLAATALHHNLTIVSRNVDDFSGTQVPILNPWAV
jgi:predicted nucleic acid-binding protein